MGLWEPRISAEELPGVVSHNETFTLGAFSIDDDRPMRVVVIGAGFSGILAGIRLRQHIKNIDLTIYEKNPGVGGTWFSNKYPTDWSSYYAPGPEILAYLQGVVDKYKLAPLIKLQHELTHAEYNADSGKWHIKVRRPSSIPGAEPDIDDVADVVLTGVGALSRWTWPDISGLDTFKGRMLHTADWDVDDPVEGWRNKKVAVIGVGSSALQLVPALQPHVGELYNFVRGKTWLSTPFASDKLAELMKRNPNDANYTFSDEDRQMFKDANTYQHFRHELESGLNTVYDVTVKNTPMQKGAQMMFREAMIQRLAKKPWIAKHLIPDFGVACRRLTPGPGYLEALCEDNVEFITSQISRITPSGIETVDGKLQELDIIVCATGYDTTFKLPFPIIGRSGQTLQSRYTPHPMTYMSLCTDDFPNWFQMLGPNSGVGSGSLLVIVERQVDYFVQVIAKMQRERLKSVDVKPEAVKDFDAYLEAYFPNTVYSEKCRSWYKMGKEEGRIVPIWPGSCLHAVRALKHPRWEDFNYEYFEEAQSNRFHWLGDGSTLNQKNHSGDMAWYLNDDEVDVPPGA